MLAAASRVRASYQGVITVSEDGDESPANGSVVKRPRGRPRKTAPEPVEAQEVAELPSKKSRGRPKKAEDSMEVELPAPVPKKRGRPKKSEEKVDDAGAEAELEDDTTPVSRGVLSAADDQVPRSTRTRTTIPSESPMSIPSAPSSSRRRSVKPSSSSLASEIHAPEDTSTKTSSKKKNDAVIEVMDELREESEKEDELPKRTTKVKTPRRSAGEDSGFSDYNPFQSGSEEAAERERRRRKVSESMRSILTLTICSPR